MPLDPAYFETRFRCDGPLPVWPTRFAIISAHATTGERWDAACDLGATFHQDAIYWVDGDALGVSRCTGARTVVPVGGFRERVD
jgi:hypothetical protein